MKKLFEIDFINAAKKLNCEVEAIKAVCEVEAPGGGFQSDGKPRILYEPFQFGELTKHKHDNTSIIIDDILYPLSLNRRVIPWSVKNAKYGPSHIQHRKLEAACKYNVDAAMMCCSWGKFQILGSNYKLCGFNSVIDFCAAMYRGEDEHLNTFVNFILANKLDDELRYKQWEQFAFQYNGPKQDKGTSDVTDDYSFFLEKAYKKFKAML